MKLLTNYEKDLYKSKTTPLLIELSKKDLDSMSKEDKSGLDISSYLAKEIYDRELKAETETNVIYIDADKADDADKIYLLEEFLERIKDPLKGIKNLEIAKEGISKGLSLATGGLFDSVFGDFIDQGVELIADNMSNAVTDFLIDTTLEYVDISDKLLGTAEEKLHEMLSNISIHLLDEIQKNEICLSSDAKKAIAELSKEFKKELTAAESFRLILQLMLSVAIDNPKILFIKNPHKLDKNSLAILSMLFSFSKDVKDKEKHTGLSIVYAYEDEAFQPYSETKEAYEKSKMLLDAQRRYTQRYAMLERPTSDIPHIAVKSTMFVGRQEELENLNARYHYSEDHKEVATLEVISGDPGVGKTKLIKEHLKEIRPKEGAGAKQIQLTLLNQVGHTSTNTGIGSLKDSIIKEAERLETVKTLREKAFDMAKDGVRGFIKNALGVDILYAAKDRFETDSQLERFQHNRIGEQDNKSQDKKQEQFNNLNKAIQKLQELSDDTMPIVLFIDDLQWIDEDSAEYLLEHFIKAFNVHIIASIRPGDATTTLKQAYTNKELNPYKVALLKEVGIKIYDNEHEIVIDSDINTQKIESNTTHLLGLDSITLTSLISQVIKPIDNDDTKQKILATTIINELNNNKTKDEVNTLFAVETINMLCDEKLYTSQDEDTKIVRLILTDMPLRFNTELTDFKASLEDTFTILHDKYETAFKHINAEQEETEFKQKFNLMAYAVLEERLHILKIYFGEHGNAAVNTLLFSSLLGTPFNSTIVKNILEAIATTDEELLQPLKEYILEGNKEVTLNESHYEIIEEVYEILSRYQAFNSAYEHRHSLLHIFLDKQLEYQLDKEFKKATQDIRDAKDTLYGLIIDEIIKEGQSQDFNDKQGQNLNTQAYENRLFFQQAMLNVFGTAYSHHHADWAEDYTRELNNLAIWYKDIGRSNEAIDLEEQSLEILEELYNNNRERWAKAYSRALSNLALSYKNIGRSKEAIELQEQTLAIRKELYESAPEIWAEDYSRALNNLAVSYSSIGHSKKAIELQEQTLAIRKEFFYESDPELWAEDYINALNNLAISYSSIGRSNEAIELQEQNLEILEELYNNNRERWAEAYSRALGNLAVSYKERVGRIKEAIPMEEKSLAICKELYDDNHELWVEAYTDALNNLANSYRDVGRSIEASEMEEQNLEILEELYNNNRERWAKAYSRALSNLALSYKNIGRSKEAIELQEQNLAIRKELYDTNREYWAEDYSRALNSLAVSYGNIGRSEAAIELLEQSLAIRKELYDTNPDQWVEWYTRALSNLAILYKNDGRIEAAIELQEQNLAILDERYNINPDRWVVDYLTAFANLVVSYKSLEDIEAAIKLQEQSVAILEKHYNANPEYWEGTYFALLNNLATLYRSVGRSE